MSSVTGRIIGMVLLAAGAYLPAQEPSPRLSVERDLTVGDTVASRFGAVHALAPTGDGGFVVVDGLLRALRRYDSGGRLVWSRPIAERSSYLSAATDSSVIAVMETGSNDRLLLLTMETGESIAAVNLQSGPGETHRILGKSADAWLVLHERSQEPIGRLLKPLEQSTFTVLRVRASGDVAAGATWIDSTPRRVRQASANGVYTAIRPPLWRPATFGEVSRGVIVQAGAGRSDIGVFNASGRFDRAIAIQDPVPVTPASRAALMEAAIGRYSQLPTAMVSAAMQELPIPEAYPPVAALHGAADGSLAVVRADRYSTPGLGRDSNQVDIYSASGARVGYAVLPATVSVRGFDGRHLFVVRQDLTQSAGVVEGRVRRLTVIDRLRLVMPSIGGHR